MQRKTLKIIGLSLLAGVIVGMGLLARPLVDRLVESVAATDQERNSIGPGPAPLMSAPELTLRTSGITWRTEGYGGPDNDVRLTALGELCVDVQRLARPPW
jgi:hypothetical protein